MFNTMTIVKLSGALLGSLLFLLLTGWAATGLYTNSTPHMADGEHAATGYVLAAAEEEAPAEEVEEVPFADMVAAADPAKGKKAWGKCKACHKLEDGANSTGPHLFNIIDRPVASVGDFKYSDAVTGIGGNWTIDQMNAWLENPKAFAPGNKMTFSGLKKAKDRAALIAYLQAQ